MTNTPTTNVPAETKIPAFSVTKSQLRAAASTFALAAASGKALVFEDAGIAFQVLHIMKVGHVPADVIGLNKSFFVQSNWESVMSALRPHDLIEIRNYNVPEYYLRRISLDSLQVEAHTPPKNSPTKYQNTSDSNPLIQSVCAELKAEYGVDLRFNGLVGELSVPNVDRLDWSFSCAFQLIRFPVSFVRTGENLMSVTLGHYVLQSRKPDGFDSLTLKSAFVHCFNLLG